MMRIQRLSSNTLKIIAAALMLVDHIGMLLFPSVMILRIIGRLAFPIFAFMIAEGCRYTRSKARYLLTVLCFGSVIQTVYYLFSRSLHLNILLTFSVSIILVYSVSALKSYIYSENATRVKIILLGALTLGLICAAYIASIFVHFDYGFFGFMTPVMASLFHKPKNAPQLFDALDTLPVSLASMSVPLLLLSLSNEPIQFFSLLSLPILMLYSGERGRLPMKHFFYIFYPLHLLILYGISLLMK